MDHIAGVNLRRLADNNDTLSEETDQNLTEHSSPDNSYSELYSTASSLFNAMDSTFDDVEPDLDEFDKNLPHTVTLLQSPSAKVYLIGTSHFSVESQNDVSKVMQAVKPHILVVELCVNRARIMQMDEETIMKEAADFSIEKLKAIFNEAGAFRGLIYVLMLKLSASLTKKNGLAPGGEFRRALKEMANLKKCIVLYGDRPLGITIKRALSKLTWWQSISLFFRLLFAKADISLEEIEKCKQKDVIEEMMAELVKEYPTLSHVLINERDIILTHSLQTAAKKIIYVPEKGRIPTRVVGIVGIGHSAGITKLWNCVSEADIPPLLVIPKPSRSDIIIKRTIKYGFLCLAVVGVYYIVPLPKSWSSSFKSTCSSIVSKIPFPPRN